MLAMARPIWELFSVNSRLIICQTISSDMVEGLSSSREVRFGNQAGVKRYPCRAASLKPYAGRGNCCDAEGLWYAAAEENLGSPRTFVLELARAPMGNRIVAYR